eukprot:gene18821-21416_t
MSMLWNLFSRSEQWRLEWGCRNCISVAFVTFLYLYSPTKHHLTRYGTASTSFAAVVTAFTKDVTIGATLTNGWSCLLGAFIATILSWIYFVIVRTYYLDSVPLLVTLICICIATFVLQYWEMVPITKKFAVGMIPIYLVNYRNEHNPSFFIWGLFLGTVIGCGCALVGCVFPFPVRLASTELRERIEYYSVAMTSLMQDLTHCWLDTYRTTENGSSFPPSPYQRRPQEEKNNGDFGNSQDAVREASNSVSSDYVATPRRYLRKTLPALDSPDFDETADTDETMPRHMNHSGQDKNSHWRKL